MKTSMFVVLASLFMACGTPKDGYVLKGNLKNAGNGYTVISVIDHTGASVIADTARMSGGKFCFAGKTPFVAACFLRVAPEGKEVLDMLIVLENSPIVLRGVGGFLGELVWPVSCSFPLGEGVLQEVS